MWDFRQLYHCMISEGQWSTENCEQKQIIGVILVICIWRSPIEKRPYITSAPKNCGGGRILPGGQEIVCHFSQDHAMVTKFLDFIHKHSKYKVVKSFFYYLDRFSRNSAETEPRLWFFGVENRKIDFFQFFHNKIP